MNDKSEDQPEGGASPDPASQAADAAVDQAGDEQVAASAAPEPDERPAGNAAEPPPAATAAPPVRKSSGAGILALLIALAAAAGTGYVWYEQQQQPILEARIEEIGRDLDRRSADLDRVLGSVDDLTSSDRKADEDIAALRDQVSRDLTGLPARLAQLESTVEKVPGISEKARDAWLRSEATYFLRVANAQLNLAGNVGVSLRALELADEQLRDLADPALTSVREAISDERAALKAVPQPDTEGIVLQLGSLARSLDSLTLANVAPGRYAGDDPGATEESGWQRAWRVVVDALRNIISVKRDDQQIEPLLTAAEESMLVRSLDVDLQIARLAVIRNEGELYRSSLDSVRGRLRTYFDTRSPAVAAALSTLDELAQAELPEQLPDISTSLRLLLNAPGGAAAQ